MDPLDSILEVLLQKSGLTSSPWAKQKNDCSEGLKLLV